MKAGLMITKEQAVLYEVFSNCMGMGKWVIPLPLAKLAARYFAWKTRRKYKRYMASIEIMNRRGGKL